MPNLSKEACDARLAFKQACQWCYQNVGSIIEYEAAATLRLEAYERMRDLGALGTTWNHSHEKQFREDLLQVWKALGRY